MQFLTLPQIGITSHFQVRFHKPFIYLLGDTPSPSPTNTSPTLGKEKRKKISLDDCKLQTLCPPPPRGGWGTALSDTPRVSHLVGKRSVIQQSPSSSKWERRQKQNLPDCLWLQVFSFASLGEEKKPRVASGPPKQAGKVCVCVGGDQKQLTAGQDLLGWACKPSPPPKKNKTQKNFG